MDSTYLFQIATSTFASTTGYSFQNLMAYATTSVLHLYIGGLISILVKGKQWIIAGLVIFAIVSISLGAMRFFKH